MPDKYDRTRFESLSLTPFPSPGGRGDSKPLYVYTEWIKYNFSGT